MNNQPSKASPENSECGSRVDVVLSSDQNYKKQAGFHDIFPICEGIFLKGFHSDLNQIPKHNKEKGLNKFLFDEYSKAEASRTNPDARFIIKYFSTQKEMEHYIDRLDFEKTLTNEPLDYETSDPIDILKGKSNYVFTDEDVGIKSVHAKKSSIAKMFGGSNANLSQIDVPTLKQRIKMSKNVLYVLKFFIFPSKMLQIYPERLDLSYEAIDSLKKIKSLDDASTFLYSYGTDIASSDYEISCGYIRTVKVIGPKEYSLDDLKLVALRHLGDPNKIDLGKSQTYGTFHKSDIILKYTSSIVGLPQDSVPSFNFDDFIQKHRSLPNSFISKRDIRKWVSIPDLIEKKIHAKNIKLADPKAIDYLRLAYYIRNYNYRFKFKHLKNDNISKYREVISDFNLDFFWQDNIFRPVEKKFFYSINSAEKHHSSTINLSSTSLCNKYITAFESSVEANFQLYISRFKQILSLSLLNSIIYFPKEENLGNFLKLTQNDGIILFYYDRHLLQSQKELFQDMFNIFCYLIKNSNGLYTGMLVNCSHHYRTYPRILEFYTPPIDERDEIVQRSKEEKRKRVEDIIKNNFLNIEHATKEIEYHSHLNLSDNKLISLNMINKFSGVETLNLKYNYFVYLNEFMFKTSSFAVNLTSLILDNNYISVVDKGAFATLVNLDELSLRANFIEYINEKVFDLPKLEKLDLSHNRIKSIETKAFKNLKKLLYLDLSHNLIRVGVLRFRNLANELQEDVFPSDLLSLDLSHNCIEHVTDKLLATPQSLLRLDLSSNKIEELDEKAFEGLRSIKYLNLSNNCIRYLWDNLFENTVELEELYLHNNQLDILRESYFRTMENIRHLFLFSNRIRTIEPRTFLNQTQLEHLVLFDNYLSLDFNHVSADLIVKIDKFKFKNLIYFRDKKKSKDSTVPRERALFRGRMRDRVREKIHDVDDISHIYKIFYSDYEFDLTQIPYHQR